MVAAVDEAKQGVGGVVAGWTLHPAGTSPLARFRLVRPELPRCAVGPVPLALTAVEFEVQYLNTALRVKMRFIIFMTSHMCHIDLTNTRQRMLRPLNPVSRAPTNT